MEKSESRIISVDIANYLLQIIVLVVSIWIFFLKKKSRVGERRQLRPSLCKEIGRPQRKLTRPLNLKFLYNFSRWSQLKLFISTAKLNSLIVGCKSNLEQLAFWRETRGEKGTLTIKYSGFHLAVGFSWLTDGVWIIFMSFGWWREYFFIFYFLIKRFEFSFLVFRFRYW